MRILLIDDDRQLAQSVKTALENYFIIEIALTGEGGESLLQINNYDLVIIDWVLPDTNGLALCERIRKSGLTLPILMLTGQTETEKKVMSLNAGADDYLTKPFSFEELVARIRSLLRRRPTEIVPTTLSVDDLTFDLNKRSVKRNGSAIFLRRKELYLLEYLMKNIGRVITREMILDQIWDSSNESLTNIVDVHIKYLRDKIDKPFDKKLIKTIHGFGYKMEG